MVKTDNMIKNEGPYVNAKDAVKEYKDEEVFYAHIEVELDGEHVEHVKIVALECLGIKLPTNYIVTMLASNIRLATEAYNLSLSDTSGKDALCDYLAQDLLGWSGWPIGNTEQDTKDLFFKNWNEKIRELKWIKQ